MPRFLGLLIAAMSWTVAFSSCSGQGGFGGSSSNSASKQQSNRPTGKNNNPSTKTENNTDSGDTPGDGANPGVTIDSEEQLSGTPISVSGAFLTMACGPTDVAASEVADGFAMLGCGVYDEEEKLYAGDIEIESMEIESTTAVKTLIDSTHIKSAPNGSKYSHYVEVSLDSLMQPKAMRATITIAGQRHENMDVTVDLSSLKTLIPSELPTTGCNSLPIRTDLIVINAITNDAAGDANRLTDGTCGSWDSGKFRDVFIALSWTEAVVPRQIEIHTNWWIEQEGREAEGGSVVAEIWTGTAIQDPNIAIGANSLEDKSSPMHDTILYSQSHLQTIDLDSQPIPNDHRAIVIKFKDCAPITCKFHEIRLIKK